MYGHHCQRKEAADASAKKPQEDLSYLQRSGDHVFCGEFIASWKGVHSMNIITVALSDDGGTVLTGCADRTLKATPCSGLPAYAIPDEAAAVVMQHPKAPVLTCAIHPWRQDIAVSGCMDGQVHVFSLVTGEVLQKFTAHQKYCVRVKWSPCGTLLATASYDQSVCLYRAISDTLVSSAPTGKAEEIVSTKDGTSPGFMVGSDTDVGADAGAGADCGPRTPNFSFVDQFMFPGGVECITFIDRDEVTPARLVVGTREDNCLTVIDTVTGARTRLNMNAFGDDFISFTPMDLSISPNGQFILVSTDKDRLLLLSLTTGRVVRIGLRMAS